MIKGRMRTAIKNVMGGVMINLLSTICAFIIRTLFVYTLGSEYLGLNSLCVSIFNAMNVLDLGIDTAMAYRLYMPLEKRDIETLNGYLHLYRKIYFAIGLMLLIVALVIMPFLPFLMKDGMPDGINVYIIFLLYALNNVISYCFCGYRILLFKADQKASVYSVYYIRAFLLMYALQMIAVYNYKFYLYTVLQLVSTVMLAVQLMLGTHKYYPDYTGNGVVNKGMWKGLFKDTFFVGIYRARDILRNALDSSIISACIGLVPLAMYHNYYTILSVPIVLRNAIVNNITPSIGNYGVTESREELHHLYRLVLFAELVLSGFFSVYFFLLIEDVIVLWIGEAFLLPIEMAVAFDIYLFLLGICDVNRIMRSAVNLWEKGRAIALIEILANVVISLVLTKVMGIIGVILGTIVCIVFICIPADWIYIEKYYFQNQGLHSIGLMIRAAIWTGLSISISYAVSHFLSTTLIIGIFFKIVISTIVLVGLFLVIFYNCGEYVMLKQVLENNVKKRN